MFNLSIEERMQNWDIRSFWKSYALQKKKEKERNNREEEEEVEEEEEEEKMKTKERTLLTFISLRK